MGSDVLGASAVVQPRSGLIGSRVLSVPSVASPGHGRIVGGTASISPSWTRGDTEKPMGTKNMGTWTSAVYTSEQQSRLGVDEQGSKKLAPSPIVVVSQSVKPS